MYEEPHIIVVPFRTPEIRAGRLGRPQHVSVVPQETPEEGVCHGARSVRPDVGEGKVSVPRAQQSVG